MEANMCPGRRTCESTRHGFSTALLLAGAALLILATPSASNIAPEATVVIHVRAPKPPGQEGCTIPGIVTCGDIVSSTELTGDVEFDIFAQPWPYGPPDQVFHLQTMLTWPASWQFVRWEPCNGASAAFIPGTGTGTLEAYWFDCPHVEWVCLVGRLVMNVDGYGRMQPSLDGILYVNCPQPVALEAVGVFAEAGVVCDFSHVSCTPSVYCEPHLSQTEVVFNSGPGGILAADIPYQAFSPAGNDCEFTVQTEATWLSGSYERISWGQYVLHLVCHPVGLPAGTYDTRALLSTYPFVASRRCVSVTLAIPENSAAPGGDEPVKEVRTSWSRLKSDHR
jgi:hypothetical protein